MLDERFVLLGGAIQIIGALHYVTSVMRGTTVPHRLTWLLWGVAPLIAFSAELSEGVGLRSLMTLLAGLGPLAILAASLATRHGGRWRMTRFDAVCGALSVVGLVLWQITSDGNVAIGLSLVADALAGAPTVRKALLAPETESSLGYLSAAVSAAITLFTIRHWTFATAGWPAYILAIASLLFVLVRFPPRRRRPDPVRTDGRAPS